ncbi:MAG: rhomboid family intramembrane serine protease, partial [bacterium]
MARIQTNCGDGGSVRFLTPIRGEWWAGARFTLAIIIINLVIWLLLAILEKVNGSVHASLTQYLAISPDTTFQQMYLWTLVTYAFVHFSFLHVFYNMLFIFFFAPQIERDFGSRKFLIFYCISAIGAALISILAKTHYGIAVPTIGASGVVMAVLVAYGMSYPNQTVYVFGMFPVKVKALIIVVVLIQMALAFQDGPRSCTDYWAHLGGLATGFIYMKMPQVGRRGGPGGPSGKKIRNWR